MDYLDVFFRAYVECALWSSTDKDDIPLDADNTSNELAPQTRKEMFDDCKNFVDSNQTLLRKSGLTAERAGHDFWLTRNRHGAGFWDRGLGKVGDELTKAAHLYGECDLYVGDDGKIYC